MARVLNLRDVLQLVNDVSTITRLRSNSLSSSGSSVFFMLARMLVINCTLNMRHSSSRSAFDRYPLSPNSFPKSRRASLGTGVNIARG
jgi:hypothetical protein